MKTKMDKKVNHYVKKMNNELKHDVFKDRFEVRQVRKTRGEDGLQYYIYELRDNLQPERNKVMHGWLSGYAICRFGGELWMELNEFIITSNFWDLFWKEKGIIKE